MEAMRQGWWLALAAAAAAIVAAVADAGVHTAMPKAYAAPLASAALVTVTSYFRPSPRMLVVVLAPTAAVVALAASGWGYALGAGATAKAFASRHGNLGGPVRCRRDGREQTLFGAWYVCRWPGARDGMLVRVDDRGIAQEYP